MSRITGLPSSGGKRPCDHLSLYRKRPNTRHPNPKQAFAKVRDATRNVDFGCVKGVSIRIKTLGSPYDECLVLVDSSEKGEKKTASKPSDTRVAKAKPLQLNDYQQHTRRTQDTFDSDYEGVKESEETLQRANGKRAKVSAAAAAVKKKEQKKKASMVAVASKKKKNIYDSSSDEDEGFNEMKRKVLAKRAAASRTKDASSSDDDDEVQVIQKKAPAHSSMNEKKRKAPPPPSSSSSSEDEEEEFDYEAYAKEAAERRAKARG